MIEISRSLIVNDGTKPELSVGDVWAGLQEKAANPMPYVKSITSSDTVLELAVGYDRVDGKQVSIPVVTIYHRREDGLVDDYRVFFDLAPVYA